MAPSCKRQVVGGDQGGQLVLPVQSRDQFKNQFSGASVEIAGRLIGQQHLRLGDERPRQRQPLLLASGKLARAMMPALFQSHLAQPPRSLLFCAEDSACPRVSSGMATFSKAVNSGSR